MNRNNIQTMYREERASLLIAISVLEGQLGLLTDVARLTFYGPESEYPTPDEKYDRLVKAAARVAEAAQEPMPEKDPLGLDCAVGPCYECPPLARGKCEAL